MLIELLNANKYFCKNLFYNCKYLLYIFVQLLSKKDDIEDNTIGEYSPSYPCGRDNNSKLQSQSLPSKLGEILQILYNYYHQYINI